MASVVAEHIAASRRTKRGYHPIRSLLILAGLLAAIIGLIAVAWKPILVLLASLAVLVVIVKALATIRG